MALEIERRFLVAGDSWRQHVRWQRELEQGYLLAGDDGLTVRVRSSGPLELPPHADADAAPGAAVPAAVAPPLREGAGEAWLTLKAAPPGLQARVAALCRLEFEYAIPLADAAALLELCPSRVLKRRHGLALPGGDWVLDVFAAENAPLVVAEVELDRADAAVVIPPWCVRELTGRHDLSNAALAARPLSRWSALERQALLD